MKKFLDLINIPKHIKNYIALRKAKNTLHHGNTFWIFVIDFLILALFVAAFYYIYFINQNVAIKKAGVIVCLFFIAVFLVKITFFVARSETKKEKDGICKLILKDEEGRNVKVWNLENKTSLLVGKSAFGNEVDIDLSDAEYASLVSKQHAVLNYSCDEWYIEDLGSTNGSGIKRTKDHTRFKLEQGKPYKLVMGDLIYIANICILVK